MKEKKYFYTGAYCQKGKAGIRCFLWNEEEKSAAQIHENTEVECPSYLCFDGKKENLYAVSETPEKGSVHSFRILKDGSLLHTGEARVSGGYTCFLSVSRDGKYLASAGFESGDIDVFLLESDGSIGKRIFAERRTGSGRHPERQAGPHVHCTAFSPYEDRLFVTDLGTDEVICYEYPDGKFGETYRVSMPSGSGPRHILFSENRKDLLYVVCEISYTLCTVRTGENSGEVIAAADCISKGFDDFGGAAAVKTDGSRIYVSNRIMEEPEGRDCISVFEIGYDGIPSLLEKVPCGRNPRDIGILGDHLIIGSLADGTMDIRRIAGADGSFLQPAGKIMHAEQISCITELRGE